MNYFTIKLSLIIGIAVAAFSLQAQKVTYSDNWGKQGLTVISQKSDALELSYSVQEFTFKAQTIKGAEMNSVTMPGVLLPNDAGKPNLPGNGHMIAVPQGAKAHLMVTDYKVETYTDVEIAPSPVIPIDTDEKSLVYEKDQKVYTQNRFYPVDPFQLSKSGKIRGVDFVMLGITPFQYNPVTKVLKVYRDVKLEVAFEGGNGQFGDPKYRSNTWESMLSSSFINYSSLPKLSEIRFENRAKNDEADYVIITVDDPVFINKANEIAEFRRKQGITTMVKTVTEIGGNTVSAIETFIDNAYNNWANPVDAVLFLGDYGTGNNGIIAHLYAHNSSWYPDYASDNYYADVDGDDLPDVATARIAAEDEAQLNIMVSKFMNYEQNPPTDADFYNNPITALGWQTERWFQICSEAIGGFWTNELGKSPVRINAVYEGNPSVDPWSTATNTSTVIDYFGPNGLGYIPATPGELGGWTGGTASDVSAAINSGAFMLQHRDHGMYTGWGEPDFTNSNISSLTNVDNKLPFIFSINCQTGAFHNPEGGETFTEALHRYTYNGENSGALGLIAATEVSYSFVNDAFVWGLYDNFWPEFMPDSETEFPVDFVYPAFGNVAGKIFLFQSSWPYNTSSKQITYRLFHHHGDAYLNVYTEVPQTLSVSTADAHVFGNLVMNVTAPVGAHIAVTYFDDLSQQTKIIGTGVGEADKTAITLSELPNPGTELLVTVTKQNYFRYTKNVTVIAPSGPYNVVDGFAINDGNNNVAEYGETFDIDLTIKNVGVDISENITISMTTADPMVTNLTNATGVSVSNLAAEAITTTSNSFSMTIDESVEDGYAVIFDVEISDNSKAIYESTHSFVVSAPELTVGDMRIDDTGNGDGILDPDETANIEMDVINVGHADVAQMTGSITTTSSYLTINTATSSPQLIGQGDTVTLIFNVTAAGDAPDGTPADLLLEVVAGANGQYTTTSQKEVVIGFVPEYCDAGSNDTSDEFIERVQIGTIDNTSSASSYTDYTDISTNVIPDSSYTLTVTNGYHFSGDQMGCWVDWNYDGDFDDAGETIEVAYSDPDGVATITVPNDAYMGMVTMRVRVMYSGTLSPCGNASYGEVEDYSLNVQPSIYAGFASADPPVICDQGETTLSVINWDGESIQWYKSSDGVSWSFITGATQASYNAPGITETTYFKAVVSASGFDPVASNIVEVDVTQSPYAMFTCNSDSLEVTITNESLYADLYAWDFGDGVGTSSDMHPVYMYAEEGTYTISLTASKNYCDDAIYTEEITVVPVSIDELLQSGIRVYPNPSTGIFNVSVQNETKLTIFNSTGKLIYQGIVKEKEVIDIADEANGLYILQFSDGDKVLQTKIIKQ
jgi:PKD repeat protein